MGKRLTFWFFLTFFVVALCFPVSADTEASSSSFTVIVLPDTQGYSDSHPEIFRSQTSWISENNQKLNIKLVVHLGDVVEHPESVEEWRRAKEAMDTLEEKDVTSLMAFGNHDYTTLGEERAKNPFNEYFPASRYGNSILSGTYRTDSADNVFVAFEEGGQRYLFLTVEYRPREEVLAWANGVLEGHPEHLAVIVTHSYMWANGFRTSSGDDIWHGLAKKHSNVRMVLCGHVPGAGVEADYGENGNKVTQILSNYQYYSNGGNGFLRIMTFYPEEGKVRVRTYSPYLDSYKSNEANEF
ncbi:MAG: metallophosphoesterase, partial [Candidatus Bipolaricaulota bacterium]